MMSSAEIRQQFLDFFKSKGHAIVPSAPIVLKDDPTLLFTNAGMNQFKDYFLGNKQSPNPRIADTQKCLRVSGKHNDLEEVGVDTYHHTMFEMLGNWSFGDYFKKEAIEWSWELLTKVYKIDKDRLYVTVFEGDKKENLPKDDEAANEWKKYVGEDKILLGNKKDNFWEMGDTGPCGPCTEIHYDSRSDEDRKKIAGSTLVNNDDPQVIEIWNNVFIQFNRKKDGSLEQLPAKHVDTGMGFERLARVIQGKQSNYDTDVFTGTIAATEKIIGKKYDYSDNKEAVAFRVLADHIRAISFTIADGQLPSNTGAGYVVRRILRRAVRYYYSYLDYKQPLLHQLLPVIAKQFENVFPELIKQQDFVERVIKEEEDGFLRTLEKGLILIEKKNKSYSTLKKEQIWDVIDELKETKSLDEKGFFRIFEAGLERIGILIDKTKELYKTPQSDLLLEEILKEKGINSEDANKIRSLFNFTPVLSGKDAFELFDTYGFPIDLTRLILADNGLIVDESNFEFQMLQQKTRSRAASALDTEDWVIVNEGNESKFVGYDSVEVKTKLLRYRKVTAAKNKESYQLVLEETPFYAESGGQVGDTGQLIINNEQLIITDTKKENNLFIHFADSLPANLKGEIIAKVDAPKRQSTSIHHSATHLLHAALRQVLVTHIAQKGSLVNEENLRFDFSHFAKMTDEEIAKVEKIVNEKIRENLQVVIEQLPKEEALKLGAMALFGEKYGDVVRVVVMDPGYSVELCGGTHVGNTGELGFFKIKHESAVAAGVRRIEAVSGKAAEEYINNEFDLIQTIRESLKNPKELSKAIENLQSENTDLKKKIEHLEARQLVIIRNELLQKDEIINNITFIGSLVEVSNPDALKKLCYDLKNHLHDYVVILCANIDGKAFTAIGIADMVVAAKNLDASQIIKQHIAPLIKGGGGGQKTLATAGGTDISQLDKVIKAVKSLL
jgi:alanyl-tRNA synthetase